MFYVYTQASVCSNDMHGLVSRDNVAHSSGLMLKTVNHLHQLFTMLLVYKEVTRKIFYGLGLIWGFTLILHGRIIKGYRLRDFWVPPFERHRLGAGRLGAVLIKNRHSASVSGINEKIIV